MVARVSAYGTWWSMANEWDLEKSKTVAGKLSLSLSLSLPLARRSFLVSLCARVMGTRGKESITYHQSPGAELVYDAVRLYRIHMTWGKPLWH